MYRADMAIEYRVDAPVTVEEFSDLLIRSTLSERRPVEDAECLRGMLDHADLIVTAWSGRTLVGIARSVTDFHYCCYLSDLAVDENFQKQGIGRRLQELTRQALGPRCRIVLLAAPAADGYYPHIGYEPNPRAWVLLPEAGCSESDSSNDPARIDTELLRRFESGDIDLAEWNQRKHVAIAFLYLRDYGFDGALGRLRERIPAFNARKGIEEGPLSGYNETTTVALLRIVDAVRRAYSSTYPASDSDTFCDAHPELMSKHILRLFYSPERRMHPDAKKKFIEPDLAPLPAVGSRP